MDLQIVIENFGYVTVLIGTFLEGKTILVQAGRVSHQGFLAF